MDCENYWFWDEAPWEVRVLALIPHINNIEVPFMMSLYFYLHTSGCRYLFYHSWTDSFTRKYYPFVMCHLHLPLYRMSSCAGHSCIFLCEMKIKFVCLPMSLKFWIVSATGLQEIWLNIGLPALIFNANNEVCWKNITDLWTQFVREVGGLI